MPQINVIAIACLALVAPCAYTLTSGEVHEQSRPQANPEKASGKKLPLTYWAAKSGVVFYVESDHQHVAAIDNKGKVLWHKNVVDQLPFKELSRPVHVVCIGKAQDWMLQVQKEWGKSGEYVGIDFSTRDFGILDQSSGVFTWMGCG